MKINRIELAYHVNKDTSPDIITEEVPAYDYYATRYIFWFDGETLWLDRYYIEGKNKKQKYWRTIKQYERINSRDDTIALKDIILEDHVISDAKNKLIELIKGIEVKKWERKQRKDNKWAHSYGYGVYFGASRLL